MAVGRQVLTGDTELAAGQRDKYVRIERVTVTTPEGFPVETWSPLTSVWMSRRELRGDERYRTAQESAAAEIRWQMPYQANMDPEVIDVPTTRRLVYRGRTYNIVAASLVENRGIELVTLSATKVA